MTARIRLAPADAHHAPILASSALTYALILHLAYQHRVSPFFADQGLTYRSPDPARYTLALFLVVVVAWCLPRRCIRFSDFMQWLPFVIAGAPSILLPQYMQALAPSEATRLGLAVAGGLLLCRYLTVGSWSLRSVAPMPSEHVWKVLVTATIALYVYTAAVAGLPSGWVAIDDVYGTRAGFAEVTAGTLVPRFLPWVYNVVNPVLVARGLFARNPRLLAFGISGQTLIYLWEGQKSVLFLIPALVGFYMLLRNRQPILGLHLLLLTTALMVTSVALDAVRGSYTLTTLFVRRFLIIPGALTVAYVVVFHDRPRGRFAELGLGNANPYLELDPAFLVGKEFVNDPTTHANVNFWGHGYFSFGYAGILLMGVLYALVLLALDASSEGLPPAVVGVISVGMALVVSSANLFTSLLTHGLGVVVLILAFLPRTGWEPRTRVATRIRQGQLTS